MPVRVLFEIYGSWEPRLPCPTNLLPSDKMKEMQDKWLRQSCDRWGEGERGCVRK